MISDAVGHAGTILHELAVIAAGDDRPHGLPRSRAQDGHDHGRAHIKRGALQRLQGCEGCSPSSIYGRGDQSIWQAAFVAVRCYFKWCLAVRPKNGVFEKRISRFRSVCTPFLQLESNDEPKSSESVFSITQ